MTTLPLDRLVRKEVALGVVREYEPPQNHIGLSLAPFRSVESDDVIFGYTKGLTAGLAPARAEDAESEMAGKDDSVGTGRASVIDWALKDHYDPSDVTRYQDALVIGGLANAPSLPLTVTSVTQAFQARVARDTRRRRRMIDNRLEWLIMTGLDLGKIVYNDNKIKFTVDFLRPPAQQDIAPPGGLWDTTTADPIGDLLQLQYDARDRYGVTLDRALISSRVLRQLRKTDKFTNLMTGSNPLYTVIPWGDEEALRVIAAQTGIAFSVYDSVYRTRGFGATNVVNTRFTRDNVCILLPSAASVNELDDMVGFAATLTSPHPEGNWQSGFYEWERSTVDPWGHDMGVGIKAFPVMPHLDLTYVLKVLS